MFAVWEAPAKLMLGKRDRFTRGSTGLTSRVEEIVRQASDDRSISISWPTRLRQLKLT